MQMLLNRNIILILKEHLNKYINFIVNKYMYVLQF